MFRPHIVSAAMLRGLRPRLSMREMTALDRTGCSARIFEVARYPLRRPPRASSTATATASASTVTQNSRIVTAAVEKGTRTKTKHEQRLLRVDDRNGELRLEFGCELSAAVDVLHIPALWLRDMCSCPACVNPDSGQKSFSTCDLPDKPQVKSAWIKADGSLAVLWAADTPSSGRIHTSVWSHDVLQAWRAAGGATASPHVIAERTLWDRTIYQETLRRRCEVSFADWIADNAAFWRAFAMLCHTGLLFVQGVPRSETAVESVAGKIGLLQETFYGRTWDVRSKPRAENVAYTSVFLGLHQDLLYLDGFPRLQLLHCLDNSCDGGESLFSDGVRAAYELAATRRDLYDTLTRPGVSFHYNKGGHHYFKERPVVTEMEGASKAEHVPMVDYISWAPPFQGPFSRESHTLLVAWKDAATAFEKTISAPENMVEYKLEPGECVIFDNTRILHGRRQFNTGQGQRWLKGCYIHRQPFQNRLNRVPSNYLKTTPDNELSRREIALREASQVADMLSLP